MAILVIYKTYFVKVAILDYRKNKFTGYFYLQIKQIHAKNYFEKYGENGWRYPLLDIISVSSGVNGRASS